MEVVGQVLGIAVFIVLALGLIVLSEASAAWTNEVEERVARGEISPEQYRAIQLARLGTV